MKTSLRLTLAGFGLATFNFSATTHYVSLESTNPVPPYATWETAATNIQVAVDAAKAGDTVLVTNGAYNTDRRPVGTNILLDGVPVEMPLTPRTVNGLEATITSTFELDPSLLWMPEKLGRPSLRTAGK